MSVAVTLALGIIVFLLIGLLGPLAFATRYRDLRSRRPSLKASFVFYAIAVEALALAFLEFSILMALTFAGTAPNSWPPGVATWVDVASFVLIVLGVAAIVLGLLLDPRQRQGGDEGGP